MINKALFCAIGNSLSNSCRLHCHFKVPLLWVMKGSNFRNQQVDMHARSKKHFHCLTMCILFLPYFAQRLPNDLLTDSFFQTPPFA